MARLRLHGSRLRSRGDIGGRVLAEGGLLAGGDEQIAEPVLDLRELGLAGDTLVVVDQADRTVAVEREVNVGELFGLLRKACCCSAPGNRNSLLSYRAVWLTLPGTRFPSLA